MSAALKPARVEETGVGSGGRLTGEGEGSEDSGVARSTLDLDVAGSDTCRERERWRSGRTPRDQRFRRSGTRDEAMQI